MAQQYLWTWGGKFFGYRDGDELRTHDGRHVGQFFGDEVYNSKGEYVGEIMSDNRLITNQQKSHYRKHHHYTQPNRGAMGVYGNYGGFGMYGGHQDFPDL